jgi:hypothetical protein
MAANGRTQQQRSGCNSFSDIHITNVKWFSG